MKHLILVLVGVVCVAAGPSTQPTKQTIRSFLDTVPKEKRVDAKSNSVRWHELSEWIAANIPQSDFTMGENHFPYVVFLQGSNFATCDLTVKWPDGTKITLRPSDSNVNRIDRVTASNYGMEINRNYCRNILVEHPLGRMMLQTASLYAQCDLFAADQMSEILWEVALTSLDVLADELPPAPV